VRRKLRSLKGGGTHSVGGRVRLKKRNRGLTENGRNCRGKCGCTQFVGTSHKVKQSHLQEKNSDYLEVSQGVLTGGRDVLL